jgi:hypothetical protein
MRDKGSEQRKNDPRLFEGHDAPLNLPRGVARKVA